jgi:hypothetical protein
LFHPRYSMTTKIVVSILVVIVTVLSAYFVGYLYSNLMAQIDALGIH